MKYIVTRQVLPYDAISLDLGHGGLGQLGLFGSPLEKVLDGAAGVVADVVIEEKPPEGNFLTVWHFLKGLPNWPMVALPPGPQGCLTQERRLVLY